MNKGSVDPTSSKQRRKTKSYQHEKVAKQNLEIVKLEDSEKLKPVETNSERNNILDMQGDLYQERSQKPETQLESQPAPLPETQPETVSEVQSKSSPNSIETKEEISSPEESFEPSCVINIESSQSGQESLESSVHTEEQNEKTEAEPQNQNFLNSQGVKFTSDINESEVESQIRFQPYGLGCIKELFRFLISLINPMNKENSEMMIQSGLTLLGCAFEVGADAIGNYVSLTAMVKDDLCRNLFSVSF